MSVSHLNLTDSAVVVGGGPAGLMVADLLSQAGRSVHVFDAMPSVGRKFLLAGKGGLNLTHSEQMRAFVTRYGARAAQVGSWLEGFDADRVRAWAHELGVETFVGSSGRVFPRDLKAAPLLRHWLHRLREAGVRFHMRHRWLGWTPPSATHEEPGLRFQSPTGEIVLSSPSALILALGGGSWPRLGSDGAWVPWLQAQGVDVAPLRAANCGFDVVRRAAEGAWESGWTPHLSARFAGAPLKNVALEVRDPDSGKVLFQQAGEAVLTQGGVEGGLIYAASSVVRDLLALREAPVTVHLNLLPQRDAAWVEREVRHPRGPRSLATHLKTRLGIEGVKAALLHEVLPRDVIADPARLATALQALPIGLSAPRPIAEAISTAGGVKWEGLVDDAMLQALPGVFVAGEMIDWEAPTGGYLLTACLASGVCTARCVERYLRSRGEKA